MGNSKKRAWHFLSHSGKISTRAQAQKLLAAGRIQLDSRPLSSLNRFINLRKSLLTIDGEIVKPLKNKLYLMHHKPVGILSSKPGKENHPSLFHLLRRFSSLNENEQKTLFAVGRLDLNSSGLIFLTNDGAWAHKILNPKSGISKGYRVTIDQALSLRAIATLEKGVKIELEKNGAVRFYQTQPCKIEPIHLISSVSPPFQMDPAANHPPRARKLRAAGAPHSRHPSETAALLAKQKKTVKTQYHSFQITLHEGKKRQIRRMFLTLVRKVTQLHRISIGPVQLGDLPVGEFRFLSASEISLIYATTVRF